MCLSDGFWQPGHCSTVARKQVKFCLHQVHLHGSQQACCACARSGLQQRKFCSYRLLQEQLMAIDCRTCVTCATELWIVHECLSVGTGGKDGLQPGSCI